MQMYNSVVVFADDTVEESLKPEIKHKFGLLAECKPYMMRVRRRPTWLQAQPLAKWFPYGFQLLLHMWKREQC